MSGGLLLAKLCITMLLLLGAMISLINLRSPLVSTRCVYDYLDQLLRMGCGIAGALGFWMSPLPEQWLWGGSPSQLCFGASAMCFAVAQIARNRQLSRRQFMEITLPFNKIHH